MVVAMDDEMLITVDELESRVDMFFDEKLRSVAGAAIWDASNLARLYGRPSWTATQVPPVVKSLVRNACVRYLNTMNSLMLSRAGDETEQYTDLGRKTGTVFFDKDEIATIREAAGTAGNMWRADTYLHSPPTVASQDAGIMWAEWPGSDRPFPYGAVG